MCSVSVKVYYEGDESDLKRSSDNAAGSVQKVGTEAERAGGRARDAKGRFANLGEGVADAGGASEKAAGKIKQVGDNAKDAADKGAGFKGWLGDVSKIAGGFVVANGLMQLPGLMSGMIGGASDLNESMSKVATVFGPDSAAAMEDWATAMSRMGQSKGEALAAVGNFGNFFATIGVNKDAAGEMSQNLVELASDFASFHNAAPVEVMDAMAAALRGEAEPMSRFGILMNDATLKAKALELGLIETEKQALTPQTKALAANALMFDQAGAAMGDFARTSDGLANKKRILSAEITNLKDKLGTALLPAALAVTNGLLGALPAIEQFGGHLGDAIAFGTEAFMAALPSIREFGGVIGDAIAYAAPYVKDFAVDALELGRVLGPEILDGAVAFWQTQLLPVFEGAVGIFEALWPHVQTVSEKVFELGAAVADKLQEPLETTFGFIAEHQEEFKIFGAAMLIAVPIIFALAGAFTAEAAAATVAGAATGVALLPVLAIAAGVGLLAVGIYTLIKNWDELVAKYPVVGEATDAIKVKVGEFTGWITGEFVPAVGLIATTVTDSAGRAIGFIVDHWGEIQGVIEPGLEAVGFIIGVQIDLWTAVFKTGFGVIMGLLDVFVGIFTGDWEQAKDGVLAIGQALWTGLKEGFDIGLTALVTIAKTIGPMIIEAIGDAAGLLYDVGKQVVQGLIDGIGDMAGALEGKVKGMAGDAISAAKHGFGIFSPSREFAEIGRQIPAGLEQGIAEGMPRALDAAAAWINAMVDEARETWWARNRIWAQEFADAGFFLHEDGTLEYRGDQAGAGGVSTGFDGWLSNNGLDRGNNSTNKPKPGPTGGPGTQGSGWAYVSNGAGGFKLMQFPLSDGQTYWYFDNAGNWVSGIMHSEGSTPAATGGTGGAFGSASSAGGGFGQGAYTPTPAPASSGLAGGAGFGSASSPGGGFGAGAYSPGKEAGVGPPLGWAQDVYGNWFDPKAAKGMKPGAQSGSTSGGSAAAAAAEPTPTKSAPDDPVVKLLERAEQATAEQSAMLQDIAVTLMKIADGLRTPAPVTIMVRAETADPKGLADELAPYMYDSLDRYQKTEWKAVA